MDSPHDIKEAAQEVSGVAARIVALKLQMYGDIASDPRTGFRERFDALSHIALLAGAIDEFTDRFGAVHQAIPAQRLADFFAMMRWEREDGRAYVPHADFFDTAEVRKRMAALNRAARSWGRPPPSPVGPPERHRHRRKTH